MAKTSSFEYLGDLKIIATHERSGIQLITDAPIDNNGKGSSFSPTDLLATSLGLCMTTIMGMAAQTHGFSMQGVRGDITKIMSDNPRKVSEVVVDLYFPDGEYTDKEKLIIQRCAKTCPVAFSLHTDLAQTVNIHFE